MLTRTKKHIQIPVEDWDKMKRNPAFSDLIEFLEDISDLEKARNEKGRDLSFDQYLKNRELHNNS